MSDWDASEVRPLAVEVLGERYRRYRLSDPAAEEAMARSLRRYGQIAPVVVCVHDGTAEVVDGFKRLAAARLLLPRLATLELERQRFGGRPPGRLDFGVEGHQVDSREDEGSIESRGRSARRPSTPGVGEAPAGSGADAEVMAAILMTWRPRGGRRSARGRRPA